MIQRLMSKWWLGLCVASEVAISVFYFYHAAYAVHSPDAVGLLGKLTLAAGVCTIAAGALTTTEGKRWLLVLNGLCWGRPGSRSAMQSFSTAQIKDSEIK